MTPPIDGPGRRAAALAAIADARAAGAELIVLPELVTSGYVFTSPQEAAALAIRPDDTVFAQWAAALGGSAATVVGGFCEAGPAGRLYNSAAVVDRGGVRAVYRKTHLWDTEKLYFTPGDVPPPVVDLPFGRLGVLICYDLEFPELPRCLALAGAELLAVPTSWPRVDRPAGEHPPEVVIAMAAARVNRVAVACADRCGVERGQEWTGGTTIVGSDGWVAAEATGDALVSASLEPARARDKRISARNDALGDRRPELYHALLPSEPEPV